MVAPLVLIVAGLTSEEFRTKLNVMIQVPLLCVTIQIDRSVIDCDSFWWSVTGRATMVLHCARGSTWAQHELKRKTRVNLSQLRVRP